jgi:acyl-CoA synthetase (AMP-forming)/AMP-acid ligase II
VHICDEEGNEMPSGESGTVFFESQTEFQYHNDPEKTKASRDPKGRGWSTLGDVGYLDEDGFLYLTDRKAFMIISGGVNIYPQESENVLINHPRVADVAVFGVPNDEFGEEVKAVVQPDAMPANADDAKALERELIAYCRSHLADLKCPRSVDFRPELPRHPTGKLYKRLLKDEYWAAAGRSI